MISTYYTVACLFLNTMTRQSTQSNTVFTGISFGMSMFGAGFCFGIIRVLLVVPSIGELPAVLVELPFMVPICWLLSKSYIQKLDSMRSGMFVGGIAFATLMLFEVALSVLVFQKTLEEKLQDLNTTKGKIGLVGQLLSSSFPVIQLKMKPKKQKE